VLRAVLDVVVTPPVIVVDVLLPLVAAAEELIALPPGTTTIVTGIHGFVGSKAIRKSTQQCNINHFPLWVEVTYPDYPGENSGTHNPYFPMLFARR
jgi:hypothetical protein